MHYRILINKLAEKGEIVSKRRFGMKYCRRSSCYGADLDRYYDGILSPETLTRVMVVMDQVGHKDISKYIWQYLRKRRTRGVLLGRQRRGKVDSET